MTTKRNKCSTFCLLSIAYTSTDVKMLCAEGFEAELTPKINPKIRDLNFTTLA